MVTFQGLSAQTDLKLYKFSRPVAPDYMDLAVAVGSARNVAKCELERLLGASRCNEMEVTQFPIHLTEIRGKRSRSSIVGFLM